MSRQLKQTLTKLPLFSHINKLQIKNEIKKWEKAGKPSPPPHAIKQKAIRFFAEKYDVNILIETGTFYGDMVEAMKHDFDRVFSIELSEALYAKAKKRFQKDTHVELVQGDSGIEIKRVVGNLSAPALFWLDGHYSAGETAKGEKDTPIFEELGHIFETGETRHVILIDDARLFGTDPSYPTVDELREFVLSRQPDTDLNIEDDIISITPRY